jgi:hypothetical protein
MIAWHFDPKGLFSVRSAYKVCRDDELRRRQRGSAQSSGAYGQEGLWRRIWNLKCPNKMKHFLWRFAHNSHPLRVNLSHRGMRIDTKCPVCNRADEDGAHLFFKCKTVRQVWSLLNLETERAALAELQSASDSVEFILQATEQKKLTMVVTLWAWWSERNKIREEGKRRPARVIEQNIRVYAAEILNMLQISKPSTQKRRERWQKPPPGKLKLNCDASYIYESTMGAWGFVIRDSDGDVVSSGRGKVNHLLGAFQAEIISCLHGIQEAIRLGISNLILETDALQVKQAFYSHDYDATSSGGLLVELKYLAQVNFNCFQCDFVPRECNRVAHLIAAIGYECE